MAERCGCGYKRTRLGCPMCEGRNPKGMEPIGAIIPRALRAFFVVEGHFQSKRHYHAWCSGIPMRATKDRTRISSRTRDLIMRQYRRLCQWPGCGSDQMPTVEHIVPVAFGGSNHPGNLTVLCPTHQSESWQRFQQLLSPNAAQGAA
jgi:hypothetical protein